MIQRGESSNGGVLVVIVTHAGALACVTDTLTRLRGTDRSEEHTSELQSLMRISYAVFCLKKKKNDRREMVRPLAHQYMCTDIVKSISIVVYILTKLKS